MCLAVPGKIERIQGGDPLTRSASVRFDGAVRQVYLAYVPEAELGDWVLVHVGFAISVLDEAAAQRSLALLEDAIGDGASSREEES
jgi:hydrogenase expression/formation protein HypC